MSEQYERLRRPPSDALRQISGGDLKGKTDINPQWRYEAMDSVFGLCGVSWKYDIVKLWDYPCQDGTVLAFASINLYIRNNSGEWSDPVPGVGGNTLVDMVAIYDANRKDTGEKRVKPNDEGYKMAITDALSVACKMIGVGADIYRGAWDGSKYRNVQKLDEGPSEYAMLKEALIDWINVNPPVFTEGQISYANKAISERNIAGMKQAIQKATEKAGVK